MRRILLALATMVCALLPATAGAVTITDTVDGFPVSHTFAEQPGRTSTSPLTALSSGAPCGTVSSGTYTLTDSDITCRILLPRGSTATVNISQSRMHACAQNQIIGQGGTVNLDHVDVDQRACNDEPAVVIEGTGSMKHSTVVHSSNPLRLGGQNITVDGNWFHDFQSAESTAHTDGLEIYGGHDMVVQNNFWTDVTGSAGANSVIFVQVNGAGGSGGSCCANVTLKGNTLGTGGSRPLFLSQGGGSKAVGPVNVIDNRFTSTAAYPQGGWDATTTAGGTSPGFGTFTGNTILVQRTGQLCNVLASNSWAVNATGANACASGQATDQPPPPPADRDGDGVPDSQDACPDVAGTMPDGCPVLPPPPPPPSCDDACVAQLKVALASMTAARDKALADLAAMTTSRDSVQALADAYKARAEKAEGTLAHIHEETAP